MQEKKKNFEKKTTNLNKIKPIKSTFTSSTKKLVVSSENVIESKPIFPPEEARKMATTFYLESFFYRGQKEKMISLLSEALRYDPDFIPALYNLAVLLSEKCVFSKAIELYQRILDKEPEHQDSLYNLGNLYYHKFKFEDALNQYHKILAINPDSIDTLYNVGFINLRYLKNYQVAATFFEKVISLASNHFSARYNLALSLFFNKEYVQALNIFEDIIRDFPTFAPVYYNLATIYRELGSKDRAEIMLEKYLSLPAKSPREYKYIEEASKKLRS